MRKTPNTVLWPPQARAHMHEDVHTPHMRTVAQEMEKLVK